MDALGALEGISLGDIDSQLPLCHSLGFAQLAVLIGPILPVSHFDPGSSGAQIAFANIFQRR